MRTQLAAVWLCFLLQAIFYCLEQPIWEGLDEWAHFAYVQNLCEHGRIPVPGDDTSIEVSRSLRYLPLPYQPGGRIPSELTHDQYWRLSTGERAAREKALRQMPDAGSWELAGAGLYEAQQAPLYYLLMVPVYQVFRHASLAARLLAVRIASVLMASLLIPLIYANGKEMFGSNRMALLLSCLAAALPGLLMDVSRAGNECLAVVLGAAMTLLFVRAIRRGANLRLWIGLGFVLGLGLLTKAYYLAFLPAIPLLGLLVALRTRVWRKQFAGAGLALLTSILTGAPWYWRMERLTGSLSGEKNAAAIAQQGWGAKFAAAVHINWLRIIYEQVYSQIWLGGWSFLRVRPWMYSVFECFLLVSAAGLCLYAIHRWNRQRIGRMAVTLVMLMLLLVLFEPGLFYQTLAVYMTTAEAFGPGWYFYVLLAPELLLLSAGAWALLGRGGAGRLAATATFCALALNVYTMHFLLLPYYTGLIAHAPNGAFHAAHISVLRHELSLSQIGRSPFVRTGVITPVLFAASWVAYGVSAMFPAVLALRISYFFGKLRHN